LVIIIWIQLLNCWWNRNFALLKLHFWIHKWIQHLETFLLDPEYVILTTNIQVIILNFWLNFGQNWLEKMPRKGSKTRTSRLILYIILVVWGWFRWFVVFVVYFIWCLKLIWKLSWMFVWNNASQHILQYSIFFNYVLYYPRYQIYYY
jgi:hypothetical protein